MLFLSIYMLSICTSCVIIYLYSLHVIPWGQSLTHTFPSCHRLKVTLILFLKCSSAVTSINCYRLKASAPLPSNLMCKGNTLLSGLWLPYPIFILITRIAMFSLLYETSRFTVDPPCFIASQDHTACR